MKHTVYQTILPTKIIDGLNIKFSDDSKTEICVPFSTYETALFASIQRGAKVSKFCPISAVVLSNTMTRSGLFQCKNIFELERFLNIINNTEFQKKQLQDIVNSTSNHCKLLKIESHVIGNILYARFIYNTDEASGHNITSIATNEIAKILVKIANANNIYLKYLSNSGNICVDKKVSAINSISGRGKKVIAEAKISRKICNDILHTEPEKIVEINSKKNLLGSIVAGSICSGNAHFANMLAGVFLSCGQDVANIVEGSQGITYCEMHNCDLYFSVTLPNVICGCVGNGKNINFVKNNLKTIGCLDNDFKPTKNASEKLACVISAIVWCGEISLLSALTNEDELCRSHVILERKNNNKF